MRSILSISLLLVIIGLVVCRIEGQSTSLAPTAQMTEWVRTVDGWEKPLGWTTSLAGPPAVHPLVVAAAQVLVSLFALAVSPGAAQIKPSGN